MTNEWNAEKEAALAKLKEERRQNQKKVYAERYREKAKIRRDRWRETMKETTHPVGFLMEKNLHAFAHGDKVAVSKNAKLVCEAIAAFSKENGLTFSEGVAIVISQIAPNSSAENPNIDPEVRNALS